MVQIGSELLSSSNIPMKYNLTVPATDIARELPAIPGAILMVFSGFLCVSVVRDRRAWIMALRAILNLAQAGVRIIPQMTVHTAAPGCHKNIPTEIHLVLHSGERVLPAGDPSSISYVGLLHRLATVPDSIIKKVVTCIELNKTKKVCQKLAAQASLCAQNIMGDVRAHRCMVNRYLPG
jgi:hypothetical protein